LPLFYGDEPPSWITESPLTFELNKDFCLFIGEAVIWNKSYFPLPGLLPFPLLIILDYLGKPGPANNY
jgi:hypothetical protein